MDLIITSLPNQFVDIHSPDCLSDHDIVSGTLKIVIPPIKKPRRKVYRYEKGDYESMRAETLKFAKEKYFNGYSDTRSVQENFNLITNKTKVLIFNKAGRVINNHRFVISGNVISCTNSYKYLGILFSASGTFTPAKKQLYDKAVKALYSL